MASLEDRLKAYNRSAKKTTGEDASFPATESVSIPSAFFSQHPLIQEPFSLAENLALSFKADTAAADLLFFDLESTGLGSGEQVYPFLIGTAVTERDGVRFSAFFAETPAHEKDILAEFIRISQGKTLISFNGKSFDLPLIIRRADKYDLQHNLKALVHIDLFHLIRRIYPEKPARLVDAENRLLGFARQDDIHGAEVAQAYFESLRFDRRDLTQKIIDHNTWDVLSLVSLTQRIAAAFSLARSGEISWAYKIHRDKSADRARQKQLLTQASGIALDKRDHYTLGKIFRSEKDYRRAARHFLSSYRAGYGLAVVDAVRSLMRQKGKDCSAKRLVQYALAREDERVQKHLLKYL